MSASREELDNGYYADSDNIEDIDDDEEDEEEEETEAPIQALVKPSRESEEELEEESDGDSSDTISDTSESEVAASSNNEHGGNILDGVNGYRSEEDSSGSDKKSGCDDSDDDSMSSESTAGSVASYDEVKNDWTDYLDGADESVELKEIELKTKLETAVKKIGFGLKEDAFLELIEIYRDPLVRPFVVDINNFTIPAEIAEKSILPLRQRIFYTTCIHLSGLVENGVFFLLQALTINPHDELFYKTSKAAIEQHQFRYAIHTLLRCKKSREVLQGLLICYYFTANKYGLMNIIESLFNDYPKNLLAAAIINFMKDDNYKFIDDRFPQELMKRYVDHLTPDVYLKESYSKIYEQLVEIKTHQQNKLPEINPNNEFDLKIQLHKDMNVQDFIRRLLKGHYLLSSNPRFIHAGYYYAFETLEVQPPPVECVEMKEMKETSVEMGETEEVTNEINNLAEIEEENGDMEVESGEMKEKTGNMKEKSAEVVDGKSDSDVSANKSRSNTPEKASPSHTDEVTSDGTLSPGVKSVECAPLALMPIRNPPPNIFTFEYPPAAHSAEIEYDIPEVGSHGVLSSSSNNSQDDSSDDQSPNALSEENEMESVSQIIPSKIQDSINHIADGIVGGLFSVPASDHFEIQCCVDIMSDVIEVVESMVRYVSDEIENDGVFNNKETQSTNANVPNSFGHLSSGDYESKNTRTRTKWFYEDRYSDEDSIAHHAENLKYWMFLENSERPASLFRKYMPFFAKDGVLQDNPELDKTYYEEKEENVIFQIQDYFEVALEEFGENKANGPLNLIAHFLEFLSKQYGKVIPKRCHVLLFKLYELFVDTIMDYRTDYRYYPLHIMMAELKNPKALEMCEILVIHSHYYIDDDLKEMDEETMEMIKNFCVRFVWAFSFHWNRDSMKTRKLARQYFKSILIYNGKEIWSFKESRHVINLRTFYKRAHLIMKLFIKNHIVEEYAEELWTEVISLITSQLDWMQESEEDRICFLSMLFKAYLHVNDYNSSCKIAILLIDAVSEFSRSSTKENPYLEVVRTVFYMLHKSAFKEDDQKIEKNVAQDLGHALYDYFKVGKNLNNADFWLLCAKISKTMTPLIESQDDVMIIFKEIELKSTNPMPSRSLMVFEMAHFFLADFNCCTIDDGALLKAYFKELKVVTRNNEFICAELNSNKNYNTLKLILNTITYELNQCICCLFKDITLKCRSKVYEHETEDIEATWELANILIPLLIPSKIPAFDDKSKMSCDILEIFTKKFDFVVNFEYIKNDRIRAISELDEFWTTNSKNIISSDLANDDLDRLLKWPRIKMDRKHGKKAYLNALILYSLSYMKFQVASTKTEALPLKLEAIGYGKQFLVSARVKKLIPLESSALAIIALCSSYQLLELPLDKQAKEFEEYLLPFYMSLYDKPDEAILQFEIGCILYQLRGLMKRYLENGQMDVYWREKLKIWVNMLPKKIIVFFENARKFDPEEDVHCAWTIDYFMAKDLGKQWGITLKDCLSKYHGAAIALRKSGNVTGAKILRGTQQGIESMEIYYKVHSHIYKLLKQYKGIFDQKTKGYLGSEIKIAAAYINIFKEHDVVKKYEYQDHEFVDTFEYDVNCDLSIYNCGVCDNITTEQDFDKLRKELIDLCIEAFENVLKKFNHYKACYRLAIIAEEEGDRIKFNELLYTKIFNIKKKLSVLHNIFENFPFIKCVDIQRNSNSKYHIAKILKLAYEAAWRSKSPLKMGHLFYNVMVSTLSGSYLFEKDFTRLRSSCIRALEGYANKAKGLIANSTETSIPNDLLIIYECFSKTKFVTETNLIKDMESIIPFTTYKRILKKRKAVPDEDGRQKQARTVANENIMSLLSSIQHLARGAEGNSMP